MNSISEWRSCSFFTLMGWKPLYSGLSDTLPISKGQPCHFLRTSSVFQTSRGFWLYQYRIWNGLSWLTFSFFVLTFRYTISHLIFWVDTKSSVVILRTWKGFFVLAFSIKLHRSSGTNTCWVRRLAFSIEPQFLSLGRYECPEIINLWSTDGLKPHKHVTLIIGAVMHT